MTQNDILNGILQMTLVKTNLYKLKKIASELYFTSLLRRIDKNDINRSIVIVNDAYEPRCTIHIDIFQRINEISIHEQQFIE